MAKGTTKARKASIEAARATQTARQARVHGFTMALGYTIVALSVLAGFAMSFRPQVFGMSASNPAIGFGLAALAGFRLYALRKELRRQAAEEVAVAAAPLPGSRRSVRRSSQEGTA
jgi:hypothetical protein